MTGNGPRVDEDDRGKWHDRGEDVYAAEIDAAVHTTCAPGDGVAVGRPLGSESGPHPLAVVTIARRSDFAGISGPWW